MTFEILVEIGPGLYGKLIEDEQQVRLKVYNAALDGPIKQKKLPPYTEDKNKNFKPFKGFNCSIDSFYNYFTVVSYINISQLVKSL